MHIALPPKDEGARISDSVESETTRLTDSIRLANREISLLREYRSRLVADVVTGQIDVREIAAELPDAETPGIDAGMNEALEPDDSSLSEDELDKVEA